MKIKVCGLKILEVETCRNLGVNYCGFILNYPKSHRFISYEHAKTLTEIRKLKICWGFGQSYPRRVNKICKIKY